MKHSRLAVCVAAVSLVAASLTATPLAAQDSPAPSPTPAPLPPASAPPAVVVPPTVPVPPSTAVALCGDGSFVVAPAAPSECGARGGLKLTLPEFRPRPGLPTAVGASSAAAETAARRPAAAEVPPDGATMRCKDGTWIVGVASVARCDANGGLAVVLPPAVRDTPPVRRP